MGQLLCVLVSRKFGVRKKSEAMGILKVETRLWLLATSLKQAPKHNSGRNSYQYLKSLKGITAKQVTYD
jgi:hypothetical protein